MGRPRDENRFRLLLAVHAFLPPLDDRGELELGSPADERSKRAEYGGVLLRSTGRRELPAPDRLPARLGPTRRLRHLPRRDRGLARPSAARHEIGPTAAAPPRTRGARQRNGFRIGSLTALRDQTMAPPRHLRLAAVVSATKIGFATLTRASRTTSASPAPPTSGARASRSARTRIPAHGPRGTRRTSSIGWRTAG